MTDATPQPRYPRRDENGRIIHLGDLVGFTAGSVAVGVILLTAIDGAMALLGFTNFGRDISGWICGILAVFVFVDEFRAYKGQNIRYLLTPVAAIVSVAVGFLLTAILPSQWLPLFTGACGVGAAMLFYALLWFTGTRMAGADQS